MAILVAIGLVVILLRPQAKKLVLSLGLIGVLVLVLLVALGSSTEYQERIASILESERLCRPAHDLAHGGPADSELRPVRDGPGKLRHRDGPVLRDPGEPRLRARRE